ncbi:hypothetical protein G6F70_001570 [Rhizopus microsporus]|uniref:LysM domain-containing protein n=2 Tax=Rhizopus TaxID=4842 RepID=A0A367JAH7_RHIAZ|nr:hypothetical protein G6F71_001685 [Rhizopus microsporus]RCH86954.1 hypothetical protein CU097_009152 [Rhizopus azygosporus]KAG1203210.1 hypothetical protein G6F70_001570 [Rhizopus microsporus]KAG1214844.1 hypothetical protein G6F69_001538 [Rhizopus microsporus]KAG1237318.1 hypothetical protein G6F67_001281 [Rhizopus microsporus]
MKFTLIATAVALATAVSALPNCHKEYVAKKGDTVASVAKQHGVSIQSLYRWNAGNIDNSHELTENAVYCVNSALGKRSWFYKTEGLSGQKLALAKKKAAAAKKHTKKVKKTTKKVKKTTKKAKKTTKKAGSNGKVIQSRPGDDWSSTPKNAPSNAVRHIISTCNKYSTVTSKDSWCGDFAKRNGISTSDLYKWNAGLHGPGKHECDNLDDGRAYCVGVSH